MAFETISTTATVESTNPGVQPLAADMSATTSAKEVTELHKSHDKKVAFFDEFMVADCLLVTLIMNTLEDCFTTSKKHEDTGCSSVSYRNLLKHFINTYTNIDEFNLHENELRLDVPYDSNQPIEELYRKITKSSTFADAGDAPFTIR